MADEIKVKPEDVQAAKDIAAALQNAADNTEQLLDLTIKVGEERKKLSDIFKEELGKQAEYIANIDAQKRLSDELLADKERELDQIKELEEIEKRIAELEAEKQKNATELGQLTTQINRERNAGANKQQQTLDRLNRERRQQRRAQDKVMSELDKQKSKRDDINNLNLETSDIIKQQLEAEAKRNAALGESSKTQEGIRGIVGRQIEETFGLKDATDSVSDALIDAVFSGESLEDKFSAIKDIVQATGDEFAKRFTPRMLAKRFSAFGNDFLDQLMDISKKVEDLDVVFTRQTGLAERFGDQLESLVLPLNQQGLLIEETTSSFSTLAQSMINFTEITDSQRIALTKNAAILSRLGVDTHTFGQAIQGVTMNLDMGVDKAMAFTGEIVNFGRELNVGANKILQQFNESLTIFATYGASRGAEIFKELAVTSKRAGIEMSTLVQIGKQFDTFEGAMRSAGKLNFILGGAFVNSMRMLNATEEERISLLRESLELSGKNFDELGRRGKEALANTLGTTVEIAQRLFNDKSLQSAEEAAAAIDANKKSLSELAKEGLDKLTIDQRNQLATEKQLSTNKQLVEVLGKLQEGFAELREFFSGFAGTLGVIAVLFNTISTSASALAGIAQVLGITGAAGLGAMILPALAVVAAIGAIGYSIYELITNFDEVAGAWSELLGYIGDGVMFILGAIGRVVQGVVLFIFDVIFAAVQGIASAIDGIVELIGMIPLVGKMLGITAGTTPALDTVNDIKASVISSVTGQSFSGRDMAVGLTYDAYANGIESAPGGMSLVGERGPEFMNVPVGSQVVPAEETRKLVSTLATFNEIVTNSADTITNITNNTTITNPAAAAQGNKPINMNLIVKMDEREIGRVAKRVSEDTIQRSMEVTL